MLATAHSSARSEACKWGRNPDQEIAPIHAGTLAAHSYCMRPSMINQCRAGAQPAAVHAHRKRRLLRECCVWAATWWVSASSSQGSAANGFEIEGGIELWRFRNWQRAACGTREGRNRAACPTPAGALRFPLSRRRHKTQPAQRRIVEERLICTLPCTRRWPADCVAVPAFRPSVACRQWRRIN